MISNGKQNKSWLERAAYTMVERRIPLTEAIAMFSLLYMELSLVKYHNNRALAARQLGMHRNTFQRWALKITGQKKQCQSITQQDKPSLVNFVS